MNALVPLTGGAPPALMSAAGSMLNQAAQANVQASFATVGYKGRNWRLRYRGEDELVTVTLTDGQKLPAMSLDCVIIGVASGISKQFYGKRFAEGDNEAPDCFSADGVKPDASAPKKQCATCAVCPQNAWGSRITEAGKKAKACQDNRRIAVVPLMDIENEGFGGPMMLRIPPMSLNNFASYGAYLTRMNAGMEFVGTRLSFNPDVAYPEIRFEALGYLTNDQAVQVVGADGRSGVRADPLIERMLNEAVEEVTHDPAQPADAPLVGTPPAVAQAAPQPAPAAEAPPVAVTPAPVQQAAPAPVAAAAPPKRRSAFSQAGAAPVGTAPAVVQAAPAAAPAATPQVAPVAPPAAPAGLESVLDDLLNAPA